MFTAMDEMVSRLTRELVSNWGWGVSFGLLSLIVFLSERPGRTRQRRRTWISKGVLLAVIVGAVIWGIKLSWISDDAFISFRYADNLIKGHGLVFNPGERVEGYTNFLWTILIAVLIALGVDPAQGSLVVGLFCFGLLVALIWRVAHVLAKEQNRCLPVVSLAAVSAAASTLLASFATSGLETMAAATLAMLALERALCNAPIRAGMAAIAGTMMHPDHGILYVALGLSLVFTRRYRAGAVRYTAPFVFIYLPYFSWRWHYYGDFFPNTYYAKSAGLNYFAQGWFYNFSFFIGSGIWAVTPLICYTVFRYFHTLFGKYLLFSTPLFLLYVAKIGGDFMYGRLLTSLVAPLLLASEIATRDLWIAQRYRWAVPALFLFSITAVPVQLIKPREQLQGITDERTYYRLTSFSPVQIDSKSFRWAQSFRRHIVDFGHKPVLAMHRVGMVGYYTRLKIVDLFGITNLDIAHRPIKQRGRPGHEKHATPAYIVNSDADISDTTVYPNPYPKWSSAFLGKTRFHLIHYEPATMQALKGQKGVLGKDIEQRIDEYIQMLPSFTDDERLACDTWFFQEFYWSRVDRSEQRNAFERRLLELSIPPGIDINPQLVALDFRQSHHLDEKSAIHFNPEDQRWFEINGRDFKDVEMFRAPQWKGEVARNSGAFVSTYHPENGDESIVHLISKPFELVGDVMQLRLAGGRRSKTQQIALLVDGSALFTATGCDRDMVGTRLWWIKPYKGKNARLKIMDADRSEGGHIIVDEVVQWIDNK